MLCQSSVHAKHWNTHRKGVDSALAAKSHIALACVCAQLEGEKKVSAFRLKKWIGKFNFIWKKNNLLKIHFQCNSSHHFDSSRERMEGWGSMCKWNCLITESSCSNFLKSGWSELKTCWFSAVQKACDMTLLWKSSIYLYLHCFGLEVDTVLISSSQTLISSYIFPYANTKQVHRLVLNFWHQGSFCVSCNCCLVWGSLSLHVKSWSLRF